MSPTITQLGKDILVARSAPVVRDQRPPAWRLFRRQAPVAGRFVADFCAPGRKLIIEIDGAILARKRAADARRDFKLRRAGFCVVRVNAELVLRHLPPAVALIRAAL